MACSGRKGRVRRARGRTVDTSRACGVNGRIAVGTLESEGEVCSAIRWCIHMLMTYPLVIHVGMVVHVRIFVVFGDHLLIRES